MVRLCPRIPHLGSGLRRSQSATDRIETSEPSSASQAVISNYTNADNHGIWIAEFKPVERPTEPFTRDQPVRCPLPEPCILNDGRVWKERMSASVRSRNDIIEEESESGSRSRSSSMKHVMLPSSRHSAPECNIVSLLEECEASSKH